jgi:hypothetical protein
MQVQVNLGDSEVRWNGLASTSSSNMRGDRMRDEVLWMRDVRKNED